MRPELSVIVPFFNEEENITRLYEALVGALEPLALPFEMVFVDDGSTDATARLATDLALKDRRVRVVRFRRNCGQTPAMAAGIDYARGEILVTMDGDLQNDPQDIPHFLSKMDEGYDVVVGWRYRRQDKLVSRKLPSRIANWLIGKITGIPIKDNGCSLKAFRSDLIKQIPLYSDMHRFIPAMVSIAGPRIAQIKVNHHPRQFGRSKYGLSRTYKVLLDLLVIKTITNFSSRPMLWFGMMALPAFTLALIASASTVISVAFMDEPLSLPIAGAALVFMSSAIISLFSGALGELIYKLGDVREQELARLARTGSSKP